MLFVAAAATCLPAGTTISSSVAAGGQITISSTGWKPGSSVAGVLNSTPVNLGALTADATTRIAGALTVPATVPIGAHELVLTGTDPAGLARTVRAPVTVTAAAAPPVSGQGTGTPISSSGLPQTGSDGLKMLWSASTIVGGGALFLIAAVKRHRRMLAG